MELNKALKNNMNFIINIIESCNTVDQLENSKRMVDFFCSNNRQNDKMPYVKPLLIGVLISKSKQIES